MRRNIRASRKDDLIREKQQWQMKYDARKQLYDDQESKYNQAEWDWRDAVSSTIKSTFATYIDKLPDLAITVDPYYRMHGMSVRFKYEHLFDERFSLNWDYSIMLGDDGEIKKESSSWSGFNATTTEQLDDLMNSVNFLKAIVDYDWATLLNEAKNSKPKYGQYVGIRDPRYDDNYKDPGYDKMIKEAELEELLSSGKWIKINSDWGSGRWAYIISETPKFYTYTTLGNYEITHATPENTNMEQLISHITNPENTSPYYVDRIKKDKLKVASPIETKTPDELVAMIGTAVQ